MGIGISGFRKGKKRNRNAVPASDPVLPSTFLLTDLYATTYGNTIGSPARLLFPADLPLRLDFKVPFSPS